mmetsp:Transcript_342/g.983  ORF Transcript_342/g.983 Transcript_342/m.983 type:complete len:222 (+) Transcript_342:1010-1675(+)
MMLVRVPRRPLSAVVACGPDRKGQGWEQHRYRWGQLLLLRLLLLSMPMPMTILMMPTTSSRRRPPGPPGGWGGWGPAPGLGRPSRQRRPTQCPPIRCPIRCPIGPRTRRRPPWNWPSGSMRRRCKGFKTTMMTITKLMVVAITGTLTMALPTMAKMIMTMLLVLIRRQQRTCTESLCSIYPRCQASTRRWCGVSIPCWRPSSTPMRTAPSSFTTTPPVHNY